MSHIPTEQEEALVSLEAMLNTLPFRRVEITLYGFDEALIREIPRGYVEEVDSWHKIVDTDNGVVTKEITVYLK